MKYLIEYSLLENLNLSKKILRDLNLTTSDPGYVKLRQMLKNNLGYIGLFTKFLYVDRLSIDRIERLYNELKEKRPYLGRLSKNISQYKSYEELTDDLDKINDYIKFNSVLKELPSKLKHPARDNDDFYRLIIGIPSNKLSEYIDFIKKKSSAYHDLETFITATKNFIGEHSLDELLSIIDETKGAKLVFNQDKIVVAWIQNKKASKKLGSESWCISSRDMWDTYNEPSKFTKQYFLWNYNVDSSDNDFMLGTTIQSDGTPKTSHLKDDAYVDLNEYINKYELDKNIFKPLDKSDIAQYFREKDEIDIKDVKIMIKSGVWKELTNRIPEKWRINFGLYTPEEAQNMKMNKIQKMIYNGDTKKARAFIESGHTIPNFIDALRFINVFVGEIYSDEEIARSNMTKRYLKKWFKKVEDDLDVKKCEVDYERYSNENDYIAVYTTTGSDVYYELFDVERHVADLAISHNADLSEEEDYFHYYISDETIKFMIEEIKQYYFTDLEKIKREQWYKKLSNLKLTDAIDNLLERIKDACEEKLEEECAQAEEHIIFTLEHEGRETYIKMRIDTLLEYAIDNDLNSLEDVLKSTPNEISDYLTEENFYVSNYNIDRKEIDEKFKEEIESEIQDKHESYGETKIFIDHMKSILDKAGFKSGFYSNQDFEFKVNFYKYDMENNTVEMSIKERKTGKEKVGIINIDDIGTFVSNRKFDFYFEKFKQIT